jgi:hypothetical protein
MDSEFKASLQRLIKGALSDIDDCERKIKSGDNSRAAYELSYAEDKLKKALRLLTSTD